MSLVLNQCHNATYRQTHILTRPVPDLVVCVDRSKIKRLRLEEREREKERRVSGKGESRKREKYGAVLPRTGFHQLENGQSVRRYSETD